MDCRLGIAGEGRGVSRASFYYALYWSTTRAVGPSMSSSESDLFEQREINVTLKRHSSAIMPYPAIIHACKAVIYFWRIFIVFNHCL